MVRVPGEVTELVQHDGLKIKMVHVRIPRPEAPWNVYVEGNVVVIDPSDDAADSSAAMSAAARAVAHPVAPDSDAAVPEDVPAEYAARQTERETYLWDA